MASSRTLKGIFPEPKKTPKRNFVEENIRKLKELEKATVRTRAKCNPLGACRCPLAGGGTHRKSTSASSINKSLSTPSINTAKSFNQKTSTVKSTKKKSTAKPQTSANKSNSNLSLTGSKSQSALQDSSLDLLQEEASKHNLSVESIIFSKASSQSNLSPEKPINERDACSSGSSLASNASSEVMVNNMSSQTEDDLNATRASGEPCDKQDDVQQPKEETIRDVMDKLFVLHEKESKERKIRQRKAAQTSAAEKRKDRFHYWMTHGTYPPKEPDDDEMSEEARVLIEKLNELKDKKWEKIWESERQSKTKQSSTTDLVTGETKGSTKSCNVPSSYRYGEVPKYLIELNRKRSELLRQAALIDPNCPVGHVVLSETERLEALEIAKQKYDSLINELNRMPMTSESLRLKDRKMEIEKELNQLDSNIRIFSRLKVYVRIDDNDADGGDE